MKRTGEVSKSGERQLAVASATLGPWRAAAVVGGLGTAVAVGGDLLGGSFGLRLLAGSLSFGLLLFFAVGGAGAALGGSEDEPRDRRIRRWAREHPWQVAAVPGAAMLVSDVVVREILAPGALFGNVWDGLWRAVLVAAVVGVVGSVAAGRRRGRA
jgi:ABC-type branched-subunit amino acid transport system permease subunit